METAAGPRVGGIVLAAGRSVRMGRPKPLLRTGDRSFLAACIAVLREGGAEPVVAVVGGKESGGREAVEEARAAGAVVARSRAPGAEQIDSLRIGLAELERQASGSTGALVLPVDHPLVEPETVLRLIEEAGARPGAVVRPVHDDRPGHPTLFPREVWPTLADSELPAGARSVVESEAAPTVDVPVDDAGVLTDIDTPAAYDRAFGGGE